MNKKVSSFLIFSILIIFIFSWIIFGIIKGAEIKKEMSEFCKSKGFADVKVDNSDPILLSGECLIISNDTIYKQEVNFEIINKKRVYYLVEK